MIFFKNSERILFDKNLCWKKCIGEYKDEIDQLINECIELLEGNITSEEILCFEKLADINPILLFLDTLDSDKFWCCKNIWKIICG